jgi:hypothetical protein
MNTTDLKRSIAGVELHAATADPAAVERVKRILDAAMRELNRRNIKQRIQRLADAVHGAAGRRPPKPQ